MIVWALSSALRASHFTTSSSDISGLSTEHCMRNVDPAKFWADKGGSMVAWWGGIEGSEGLDSAYRSSTARTITRLLL